MERWLKDARNRAKDEAEFIIHSLKEIAATENLDEHWFIDEVVKNIHNLKGEQE